MYYPITHDNGKKDKRYTITQEYDGNPSGRPQCVLRFCDDYLGSFKNLPDATLRAVGHNAEARLFLLINQWRLSHANNLTAR